MGYWGVSVIGHEKISKAGKPIKIILNTDKTTNLRGIRQIKHLLSFFPLRLVLTPVV